MRFTQKRGDTLVSTIEKTYGINLNARGDTLLRNLLDERGFESQTQLLNAFYGRLTHHPKPRRIANSFHYEDIAQVQGFRLMLRNEKLALDLRDKSLITAVNSENKSYIRQVIKEKIARVEVVVCLIGNGTAWREWVEWELETAIEYRKGVCGVRLKDSRGRTPDILRQVDAPVARWGVDNIISAIECAAARRS